MSLRMYRTNISRWLCGELWKGSLTKRISWQIVQNSGPESQRIESCEVVALEYTCCFEVCMIIVRLIVARYLAMIYDWC